MRLFGLIFVVMVFCFQSCLSNVHTDETTREEDILIDFEIEKVDDEIPARIVEKNVSSSHLGDTTEFLYLVYLSSAGYVSAYSNKSSLGGIELGIIIRLNKGKGDTYCKSGTHKAKFRILNRHRLQVDVFSLTDETKINH